MEIAAALRREIRVIPVLLDGATMPGRENDLPDDLQLLVRRKRPSRSVTLVLTTIAKGWLLPSNKFFKPLKLNVVTAQGAAWRPNGRPPKRNSVRKRSAGKRKRRNGWSSHHLRHLRPLSGGEYELATEGCGGSPG